MSKVKMTVRQIMDLGLWNKVCEYKKWDPWILNEGRIDYDEIVEFDSEFKEEEIEIEYSRDNWNISVEQLSEWFKLLTIGEDIETVKEQIQDILHQCV
ncbi:hypothetical protein ACR77J_07835 [Tissierella praeacuta]|uniref:hypothetical protein n=1 Tax=Tissierella praeacuta TaxID=43131 RepID=UPI003DA4BE63